MKYLITGTPRSRTAWLAAVCTAHGSMCYHDSLANQIPADIDAGISDPGIATLQPELIEHNQGALVVIDRGPAWVAAFERAFGVRLTRSFIRKAQERIEELKPKADLLFSVESLELDVVVAEIIRQCTTMEPNMQIIRLYQQLQIQQNVERVQFDCSRGVSVLG